MASKSKRSNPKLTTDDDMTTLEDELGVLATVLRMPPLLTPFAAREEEKGYPIDVDEYVKHNSGWVYASSRAIAQGISGAKAGLFKMQGTRRSEWQELSREHALSKLFRKPNAFNTYVELMNDTVTFLELTGNAYWYIVRGAVKRKKARNGRKMGEPTEIWLLPSQNVRVRRSGKKFISGYTYEESSDSKAIKIAVKDMIHFKYTSTTSRYYGMAPLAAAADTVNADEFITKAQDHAFRNAPNPSVIVSVKDKKKRLGKKGRRLLELLFRKFISAENQRKALILDGDISVEPYGTEPKEMDFQASSVSTMKKILAIFGVSPTVLGMLENASRSNMEAAQYAFAKWTLEPKARLIESKINAFIAREWPNEDIVLEFETTIPPDRDADRKDMEFATKAGIATIDEGRLEFMGYDKLDFPKEDEPGSTPLIPAGVAPLFPVDTLNPALGGKGQAGTQTAEKALRAVERLLKRDPAKFDVDGLMTILIDEDDEAKILDARMSGHISDLVKKGAVSEASILDLNPDDINISAQPYVDAMNARADAHWKETVVNANHDELRAVLEEGLREGLDAQEIADLISDKFVTGSEGRKINIARTEVVGSMNSGALAFDEEAGADGKEWIATMDARTRDTHREADGQIVPIKGLFKVGDARLQYPGDASSVHAEEVCQCRCTQAGVFLEEENSRTNDDRRVIEISRVTGQKQEIPAVLVSVRAYFDGFGTRMSEKFLVAMQ
jgi:HK97 family phage portal protein